MTSPVRRYVFMEYSALDWATIKKLEKISEKIFVFAPAQIQQIPFELVQVTQKIGKRLKWLSVNAQEHTFISSHIAFIMGKWHERAPLDVEFAIISETDAYDNFVLFINSMGRKCMRVNTKTYESTEKENEAHEHLNASETNDEFYNFSSPTAQDTLAAPPESNVFKTVLSARMSKLARQAVENLSKSGDRPTEVNELTHYLIEHNPEIKDGSEINKIIGYLIDGRDISILNEEVVYHF